MLNIKTVIVIAYSLALAHLVSIMEVKTALCFITFLEGFYGMTILIEVRKAIPTTVVNNVTTK